MISSIAICQTSDQENLPVWSLTKKDSIGNEIGTMYWSDASERKSSRLIYFISQARESGKDELINADSRKPIKSYESDYYSDYLTESGNAFIRRTMFLNGKPVRRLVDGEGMKHYEIYDINSNLLTRVEFNNNSIYFFCGFDDGQYIGLDYQQKQIHYVYPTKEIYRVITPQIMPHTTVSGVYYNSYSKDIHIYNPNNAHLVINEQGDIIWELQTESRSNCKFSYNGEYMALLLDNKDGTNSNKVQIYNRSGQMISSFVTGTHAGKDFFTADNKHLLVTDNWKIVKLFDIANGELVQECMLNNFRPVYEVAYSIEKQLIFILHSDTNPFEGDMLLSVFPVGGNSKRPAWQYNLGYFKRKEYDTHLSVSHDGTQITAYSQGKITILQSSSR